MFTFSTDAFCWIFICLHALFAKFATSSLCMVQVCVCHPDKRTKRQNERLVSLSILSAVVLCLGVCFATNLGEPMLVVNIIYNKQNLSSVCFRVFLSFSKIIEK